MDLRPYNLTRDTPPSGPTRDTVDQETRRFFPVICARSLARRAAGGVEESPERADGARVSRRRRTRRYTYSGSCARTGRRPGERR